MLGFVDVPIVGAGPVGLSLAIELGRRGTADELRRVSPMPMSYPANVVFATRMNGPPLARFEDSFNCTLARNDLFAEGGEWMPQYVLEEVLRTHAASLPSVRISFDTLLESCAPDPDGVTATLVADDARQAQRCRYLVGADGAKSLVRKLIDVKLLGDGSFAPNLNLVFRSETLAALHSHGPAIMYWMVNDDVPVLLGPMSGDGLWYFIATEIAPGVDPASIDFAALIRRSTGLDCDIEIVGADPWAAHRLIAERYRRAA